MGVNEWGIGRVIFLKKGGARLRGKWRGEWGNLWLTGKRTAGKKKKYFLFGGKGQREDP